MRIGCKIGNIEDTHNAGSLFTLIQSNEMNLRLFVLVSIIALVTGSWLSITFRRVNDAVSNVFGKEFSNAGNNIQNAMMSLERMSLTVKSTDDVIVHTPEAVEALTIILKALDNMTLSI